jgi:transposase-like protein
MSHPETKEYCPLCGQPVEIPGYILNTAAGRLRFCCAGCLSLYQLVNKEKLTTTTTTTQLNNKEDIKK